MDVQAYVGERTDKYFTKSRQIVEKFGDKRVTYGVFMRRDVLCAIDPAIEFLKKHYPPNVPTILDQKYGYTPPESAPHGLEIKRLYPEGAFVADQKPLFTYTGSFAALVELETLLLRQIGIACVSAYNAYKQCKNLPRTAFIDMHARHSPGDDLSDLAAYGASVGSNRAKLEGAVGFIGTSQDRIAHYYGTDKGIGTMPHAIIGYAGSTLRAAQMYNEAHPTDKLTVLVDYFGQELTDSLEVAKWWTETSMSRNLGRGMSVRLDTHGGRFCEGLDWNKSVEIVAKWLHVQTEYEALRRIMGDDAYDMASNEMKDRVRKHLFGPGVSVANVINMRSALDAAGYPEVKIVASSGFNLGKCKVFANASAPVDVVGTGSFIPETLGETFATADIFRYDDEFSVKVGRESLFRSL